VKRARKRSAAPLVNAVLRKAAKETSQLAQSRGALASLLPKELPLAEQMGILHSHPTWLVERWLRNFGEDEHGNCSKRMMPFRLCRVPCWIRGAARMS